jgi:hypothetical protein
MKILKTFIKVKYCEMNKESNLLVVSDTFNPSKLPKRGQNMKKKSLMRLSQRWNIMLNTAKSLINRKSYFTFLLILIFSQVYLKKIFFDSSACKLYRYNETCGTLCDTFTFIDKEESFNTRRCNSCFEVPAR